MQQATRVSRSREFVLTLLITLLGSLATVAIARVVFPPGGCDQTPDEDCAYSQVSVWLLVGFGGLLATGFAAGRSSSGAGRGVAAMLVAGLILGLTAATLVPSWDLAEGVAQPGATLLRVAEPLMIAGFGAIPMVLGFLGGRFGGGRVSGERAAQIAAREKSGTMTAGEAAFYREASRGRIFECGRCGKPLSPYWMSCQHCRATFDLYPPVATDRKVGMGA
jgi:hypothetical protein